MAQQRRFRWLKGAAMISVAGLALALVGCGAQHRFDQVVRDRFAAPGVPTVVLSTNALADFPPGFGSDRMRRYWIDSQRRLARETAATHRTFPQAGHYLQIEQASDVADMVLTSIASPPD